MIALKGQGDANRGDFGRVFQDRTSRPGHVRAEVRRACRTLGIKPLGSHGFRKLNAQARCAALRDPGPGDELARLEAAGHLGYNPVWVTVQSYVAAQRQRG